MNQDCVPTGREIFFPEDGMIVSKTDLKGKITYCNKLFMQVSGYSEQELIGTPHSILRHPDMPRCVFKLLWDTISAGSEIFAYVKNMAKNGDHYWVMAHVTPSFDQRGAIIGYHSSRRLPRKAAVLQVEELYKKLLLIESSNKNSKESMQDSFNFLINLLKDKGVSYEKLVLTI